ncbi:MAG: hypothetical protein L3K26_06695 [Candidatus Hydrogenedentes bacterium]|nr:hypothetical protein [Candidatus Hydrogenedentota bacterium]
MFIVDAFLQIFDFFRALIFSGQVPQDNVEADIFNFLSVILNIFSIFSF